MGITNFYKWVKNSYKECITNIGSRCYNHVYIDLNYLLHMCYYNSDNLDSVIKKLSTIILDICTKTQPSDTVNLYCDGTSPFAKLIIQRERRFSSKDEISLNFTPGTKFIMQIPDKLHNIIEIIKNVYNVKVTIDTKEPGEGEIKIKNKLLEHYNKDKNKTHILVTNDADVILILTSHESYKKCNILLKDDVLSVSKLIEIHIKRYNIKSLYPHLDYSFLNLLMGNDYMPKVNLLTLEKLWDSYKINLEQSDDKYLIKILDNHIIINKNLLIDILHTLIYNIPHGKIKKDMEIYNEMIYENYFDGLIWNFHMYQNGICVDYYYMCHRKKPINIMNLLIYLYSNKIIDKLVYNKINRPIPSELCCILLLPESGRHLIEDKYLDFIDNLKSNINIYDTNYKINKNDLTIIMKKFINYF